MSPRRSLLVALALLIGLAGCGRSTFIGRQYDNFTAYYNTFYNAENAYDEGVESLAQEDQPIDRDVYLPLFSSPDQAGQAQAFNDAIDKSADILREHPQSKWVDDALLLIGKSYFYLQNYVGAEQKFREVMTLGSGREGEARFWLARTLIAAGRYEAAEAHLQESLARDNLDRRWEARLRLAEGELAVKRQDWEVAAAELEEGLQDLGDNDLSARGYFLLGQVYETLERYEASADAFERASDFNPLYELDYAARFSAVRVRGLHGNAEDALDLLRRMERDDKNYENRAELAYLRGRIYQAQGRADAAFNTYYDLLYDADTNAGDVAGKTYYALGALHRDLYRAYPLAAAYFDTAATRLQSGRTRPGSGRQRVPTPAAVTDAPDQQRIFSSFRSVATEINRMDSLLALGTLDDEAFQEFVLELREQRAEELAEQRRREAERQAEEAFRDAGFQEQQRGTGQQTTVASAQTGEAGFLFHRDPVRMEQGRIDFVQRWGDRPLMPNWRRSDAIASQASARGGEGVSDSLAAQTGFDTPSSTLPTVDVSDVPRDSASQAVMRGSRAKARYELANVLFLSMNRPDSAAAWYRMVIEEDSSETVAQRAYYALAEVQQALGDSATAQRLYRSIATRYPDSDFAARAREQLGMPAQADVVSDTLALAQSAYERAYATWQDAAYGAALDSMMTTAVRYRTTPVAPRALLAAGTIYQEWARRDSLDLEAPLPVSVPDSVLLDAGLLTIPEPEEPSEPASTPPDTSATRPTETTPPDESTPADSAAAPSKVVKEAIQAERPNAMPADTTAASPSDATPADTSTVRAIPDSLAADRAAAPADSVVADTVRTTPLPSQATPTDEPVPADTTAAAEADTTTVPPEPEPLRLQTLYERLVALYPQSPQAERARLVIDALKERKQAA
ncbi:MAG: tetratricopeptide repeat protein, partial [Bacteroidetes bacterium]|nr:tetratricopeptide repeat protein [Bacteroidota bacterium]